MYLLLAGVFGLFVAVRIMELPHSQTTNKIMQETIILTSIFAGCTNDAEAPLCFCGLPAARLMSRSARNPNRWFFKCSKFKDDPLQCKFFVWEDQYKMDAVHDENVHQIKDSGTRIGDFANIVNAGEGSAVASGSENTVTVPKTEIQNIRHKTRLDNTVTPMPCALSEYQDAEDNLIEKKNIVGSEIPPVGADGGNKTAAQPNKNEYPARESDECFYCGGKGHWYV